MHRVLLTWLGVADLRGPEEDPAHGPGALAQILATRSFDEVVLLVYFAKPEHAAKVHLYTRWLTTRAKVPVKVETEQLDGPTDFGGIYEAARRACGKAIGKKPRDTSLAFNLSSGTSHMAAVWMLLGKTIFPADLLESSIEAGVRTADIPLDIAVEFLPDLLREPDQRLRNQSAADSPPAPEFADILHRSRIMARLVQRARRVAVRNVPVLLEGESGTGKEMLMRSIHRASPRRDRPFVAVNCGALPADLVESELFGHEIGAFTGASQRSLGYFEAANGGTLFLDEIGELPPAAQVKILRALQEGTITRLGSRKPISVDVRVVAATNRTLKEEIAAGRFREDLFYRLAVAVLKIPPLRDRDADLSLLIDRLLEQVERESGSDPSFTKKKLSLGAKNVLLAHSWPGNVRELRNTLHRITLWSEGATLSADDAREALLPASGAVSRDVLGRPLGAGCNLREIVKEVERHYLVRALDEAGGNKKKAAELVGLRSYQALAYSLRRTKIKA